MVARRHKPHHTLQAFIVRNVRYVLALLVFAALGLLVIRLGGAATFVTSSEAETGTVAGAASKISDPATSNGQAVVFGSTTPAPTNLKAITGGNSIALLWDMPRRGVKQVEVFRNNAKVATVTPGTGVIRAEKLGTRYIDKSVARSTTYQYKVRLVTTENNISDFSTTVQATHPAANGTTPVPTVTIDTTQALDLVDYLTTHIKPEVETWYPKISDAIAYPSYTPRNSIRLFMDPAYTGIAKAEVTDGDIIVSPSWLRDNLEDGGGVFLHEATHFVQAHPTWNDPTGWALEGIADWTRDWFTRERFYIPSPNATLGRYSQGAMTAQWAETKYSPGFIRKLNAALRNGTYTASFIPSLTGGRTDAQLFAEAKQSFYGTTGTITGINGKCLDIQDSSPTAGAKLQLLTCNGSNGQKWTPIYRDSFLHGNTKLLIHFVNQAVAAEGRCVDVYGFATTDGATVFPWHCNFLDNQEWTKGSNGSLVSPYSAKCLSPLNGSAADGTQIVIATCNGSTAQRWTVPN